MIHQKSKRPMTLQALAAELLAKNSMGNYSLAQLESRPNHPTATGIKPGPSWQATITKRAGCILDTDGDGNCAAHPNGCYPATGPNPNVFQGYGKTPVDAVTWAICSERLFAQGWG